MKSATANILFLFLSLFMYGCSKEEASVPQTINYLASDDYKDWKLEKVNYLLLNVTDRIPDCQQDEIYRFYADGRGEIISGSDPCNSTEPAVQSSGRWELGPDGETILVYWKDGYDWQATINQLSNNELVVTGKVFDDYTVKASFRPVSP